MDALVWHHLGVDWRRHGPGAVFPSSVALKLGRSMSVWNPGAETRQASASPENDEIAFAVLFSRRLEA